MRREQHTNVKSGAFTPCILQGVDTMTPLTMSHPRSIPCNLREINGGFLLRMKKTVNLQGLQEYVAHNRVGCVRFYTENQQWYRASDPCKIRMAFPIMLICENPNLVCLKSGQNTISFDRVKFVEIDTETTVLGTILTLFCGDFGSDGYDTTYKLIAS